MAIHKCPIIPGSISEVVLNYLYIRSRSTKGAYATRDEIFELAPNKFKKIDNLQRALDRLESMRFVTIAVDSSGLKRWAITKEGLNVPHQVANVRRQNPSRQRDPDYD